MGNTISITKHYIERYKTMYNEDCLCHKCSIPLIVGEKALRHRNYLYCIPCSEIIYFDSQIEISDEELNNFFKIIV